LFEDSPRLGLIFPPPVIHGLYQENVTNFWGINYKNTIELASRLGINVPIDNDNDPLFPAGGMFWFRQKALKKIYDYDWKYGDFPDEPLPVDGSLGHAFERVYCYAAQSEGYYSAWAMTDSFTSEEITSLSYLLAKAQRSIKRRIFDYVLKKLRRYPWAYDSLRRMYRFFRRVRRKIS
jgi:rhamnosyltransferase